MKTYTESEIRKLQEKGATVIRKPRPKPKQEQDPRPAPEPQPIKQDTVIANEIAENMLRIAEKQADANNKLTKKITEVMRKNGTPISVECTITHRDSQGRLRKFRIDPILSDTAT